MTFLVKNDNTVFYFLFIGFMHRRKSARRKTSRRSTFNHLVHIRYIIIGGVILAALAILANTNYFRGNSHNLAQATTNTTFTLSSDNTFVNEDDTNFQTSGDRWLGNGQSRDKSYLGLLVSGETIPQGAHIEKAELKFTQPNTEWIGIAIKIKAEDSSVPENYSSSSRPSSRNLLSVNNSYSDNVKWEAGQTYSYDVTSVVQEYVNKYDANKISLLIKGTGGSWSRKYIYKGSEKPRLEIQYTVQNGSNPSTQPSTNPLVSPSATPSLTPTATPKPSVTPSPTPNASVSPTPMASVMTTPPTGGSGAIFGVVGIDTLGTCSAQVHDKYVTTGPDGKLYRTWHPVKDPSGCTFAHEHGDDPATSTIFAGTVPFGYVAAQLDPPMDEPHVGFKCFVHNKGQKNDEGSAMLHDTYFCFHMGTGGPARFTARFHSLDFHMTSASGYKLNVQGMADIGNVGTICNNPRQRRTVQGFGCLLDSPYEIWEDVLQIRNKGSVVASAIVSTAVFDPITSMDPADLSRTVYTWSDEAQQKIFKFNDPRNNYRGCNREAYSGPVNWYNRGASQTYYTDPYGNVVDGGVLKQEISAINTSQNTGYVNQFSGLTMTYKGSEIMTQFKYHKSACVSGLGIKN